MTPPLQRVSVPALYYSSSCSKRAATLCCLLAALLLVHAFHWSIFSIRLSCVGIVAERSPPLLLSHPTASPSSTGSNSSRVLHLRLSPTARPPPSPKPQPLAFIGVMAAFGDYAVKRTYLRQSWFPADAAAMKRVEQEYGFILRFVVGQPSNPEHELALQQEVEEFGPYFLRLPINESYAALPWKTHMYVVTAFRLYNPKFVVKMDDDVYLRLDRLHLALAQYEEHQFGYVGCMHQGRVTSDPLDQFYEPQKPIFNDRGYHRYASGSLYVLADSAAKALSSVEPTSLRHLANEDAMMGMWMLAFDAKHFDDKRLCTRQCLPVTVGTAAAHIAGKQNVLSFPVSCGRSPTVPAEFKQLPILPPKIVFDVNDTVDMPKYVLAQGRRRQTLPIIQPER